MERVAVIMGKMHSGGKKNLVMEYYRNIDKSKVQFDFFCDTDSNAIPQEEIEKLGGRVYRVAPYQNIFKNMSQMKAICKKNKYKIMHSYNGTMNLFSMFVGWQCGIPIRISESISMAHSADKKTILKNILKPFSKMFATNFMANGEACGRWQFGDKLFDEGKVRVFKTVINTDVNKYDESLRNATRKEYGIEENIVIGHIGRLTEQKNTLFIIDIFNAFAYSGERQQGLFNAGLCTMNFINGLHARGIGSCCLQWSNKHAEDLKVRKALELQDSERIAVVIAAGYYLEETVIPCSVRKSVDDIYKEI